MIQPFGKRLPNIYGKIIGQWWFHGIVLWNLPSGKLTWLWKITMFNGGSMVNSLFLWHYGHVQELCKKLPEGNDIMMGRYIGFLTKLCYYMVFPILAISDSVCNLDVPRMSCLGCLHHSVVQHWEQMKPATFQVGMSSDFYHCLLKAN